MDLGVHLEVAGTGSYLPEKIRGNDYFVGRMLEVRDGDNRIIGTKEIVDTEKEIVSVTGIRERRVPAPGETPSDMGYEAARKAIHNSGIDAGSLVGIVMASVSERKNFPDGASKIQKKLGIRGCFTYDLVNACAGFTEALIQVDARVLRDPGNYLVVASEDLTMLTDNDINSTLFGASSTVCPSKILANTSLTCPLSKTPDSTFSKTCS